MNQEHDWYIQLEYMQSELRYVLENLDSGKREVKDKIENVYLSLGDLCEQAKN